MGELLRAVCDATAIDSNPAFYSTQIDTVTTVTGAKTFVERVTFMQLKEETWFLLTSWYQTASFTTIAAIGAYGFGSDAESTTFEIRSAKSGRRYMQNPELRSNANFTLNNGNTLPEYILFEPGDTIEVRQQVQITSVTNIEQHATCVVLNGIEYRMPAGKGVR